MTTYTQLNTTILTLSSLLTEMDELLRSREEELKYSQQDLMLAQRALTQAEETISDKSSVILDRDRIISYLRDDVRILEEAGGVYTRMHTLEQQNTLLLQLAFSSDTSTLDTLRNYMLGEATQLWSEVGHHGYRPNKIAIIKQVREITKCGLKEAKELVESFSFQTPTPATQQSDVSKSETIGELIKRKLGERETGPVIPRKECDTDISQLDPCGINVPEGFGPFPAPGDAEPEYDVPPVLDPTLVSSDRPLDSPPRHVDDDPANWGTNATLGFRDGDAAQSLTFTDSDVDDGGIDPTSVKEDDIPF